MIYLLPFILSAESCMVFDCRAAVNQYGCVSTLNSHVYLSPCTSQYLPYCPYADDNPSSTCVFLSISPFNTSWPGDFCYSNSTCVTEYCLNSICQGFVASTLCNDTEQCAVGLRCAIPQPDSPGNCKVQLFIGPNNGNNILNCTVDSDCVNNGACENFNCFEYFSRTEGEYVVNCGDDNVNWLCQSGMCYDNLCVSPFVTSKNSLPMICSNDSECISDYYNAPPSPIILYSSCQCGYNQQGNKYCTLFPGDPIKVKYLNILQQWLNSDELFSCHSYSRFKLECIKQYWTQKNYLEYAYYYYWSTMYPQIQNNPSCVQNIITYHFYNAQNEYNDYHSKSVWILLSLFISYII